MESISSVQLENKTNKKFLTSLIPKGWEEIIYDHNTFYACKYKRNDQVTSENYINKEKQFEKVCDIIENEFGEHLMEIYSITSCGIHFIVYLRKNE